MHFVLGCGSGGIIPAPSYNITLAAYNPLCIDVRNASKVNGDKVIAYACGKNEPNQQWTLNYIGSGYNIVNVNSGLCMAVFDLGSDAPGQVVIQETCMPDGSKANQVWSIAKDKTQPGYNVINVLSKQCLDLPYGAIASVFQMQQYFCTAKDPAQSWTFIVSAQGVQNPSPF